MDQDLGKVAVNPPIPVFIGISQGAAGNLTSDSNMVELLLHNAQTAYDVAKTFAIGQLGKCHAEKLIIACKRTSAVITVVAVDALAKFLLGQEIDDLGENRLALVHAEAPFAAFQSNDHEKGLLANSNRSLGYSPIFCMFSIT